MRVVMFVFAGRKPNMELQVPLVKRILEQNPDVEYDVWNFAGNERDHEYLQTIEGERITVRNDFVGKWSGWCTFDNVYYYYRDHEEYKGCVFVKLDDDVVFLQTERFGTFLDAIVAHPDSVVSANTLNNGACSRVDPALWDKFNALGIVPEVCEFNPFGTALLDIHRSNEYADMVHNHFFEYHDEMLGQPIGLIPTEDWLSINCVGYGWETACQLADKIGSPVPHPPYIAERSFPSLSAMGDEGAANLFPRIIVRGFLAGHLSFGGQYCTDEQLALWRSRYADIGEAYLDMVGGLDRCSGDVADVIEMIREARDTIKAGVSRIVEVDEDVNDADRAAISGLRRELLEGAAALTRPLPDLSPQTCFQGCAVNVWQVTPEKRIVRGRRCKYGYRDERKPMSNPRMVLEIGPEHPWHDYLSNPSDAYITVTVNGISQKFIQGSGRSVWQAEIEPTNGEISGCAAQA